MIRAILIASVFMIGLYVNQAYPRDLDGRYAQSPNHEWINSLRNQNGMACCDTSDGFHVEDPDWRNVGDAYEVKIDGQWRKLEAHQIITEPNRLGYAMVWIFHGAITCFMPGARG